MGSFTELRRHDGAFNRERFFGQIRGLRELVSHLSDSQVDGLTRGGHDPVKIYAAFDAAMRPRRQPTVILALTKKDMDWDAGQKVGCLPTNKRKLDNDALRSFRDRFKLPLSERMSRTPDSIALLSTRPEMSQSPNARKGSEDSSPRRATTAQKVDTPNAPHLPGLL